MITVATVMMIVVRADQMTRLSWSRPSRSVPNGWCQDGRLERVVEVLVSVVVRRDDRREQPDERRTPRSRRARSWRGACVAGGARRRATGWR